MKSYFICCPNIYSEEQQSAAAIEIAQGKIVALHQQMPKGVSAEYEFSADHHLIPGMIDLHIHGADGADVMDATPEALTSISKALVKEGTTGFLATTMTESLDKIAAALTNVKSTPSPEKGAAILGVHLEGPFLSKQKMGAQCGDYIIEPNIDLFDQWQAISGNQIKLVTIAPEQKGAAELISHLRQKQITVALGHSDATFAEAQAGIAAGGNYATHLFNAMRGIHHREPGIATALLLDDRVTAELVLDNHHLHPGMVQLALKVKGKHRLVLVTDSMRAKCLGEGRFELGGQAVIVKNGLATLENGTIAGSVLKMNQALKNLLQQTGSTLHDAIDLTSLNPAKLLNLKEKGSVAIGKDADFTILNANYEVVATFIKGRIVYG